MKYQKEKHTSWLQTKNFLVQTCSHCNEEMHVGEGDIIFGGKWFHNSCWQKIGTNFNDLSL